MEERVTTQAEFEEEVRRLAADLGEVVWEQVVEEGNTAGADSVVASRRRSDAARDFGGGVDGAQ